MESKRRAEALAPCIFLHGFAQTPATWDTVASVLRERGHRTYAIDLYRQADRTLPELCSYVAEAVEKVAEVEGAPVLVGYSMGGRIAAETLVRHGCEATSDERQSPAAPLPLAGLVLESAGLGPRDEAERASLVDRNAAWAQRLRDEGVESFMDWWETLPLFASQQSLSPEARAALRAERTTYSADELAHSLEAWGAHHQSLESETLAALARLQERDVAVLYVAGSLDEKYAAVTHRVSEAGLRTTFISDAIQTALIPNAGHNGHMEQPQSFASLLASCMESREAPSR
ncbi:alpha/beta fold hydrolase [Adlercreutzia sp. R25]|uniref:Alpha/beta fold hydrolase n=1 Tax=Adlercreutzia shanghongiae TaxID=3111773 RepID=A0ABU6IWM3_9ACTN|nr:MULTISPECIES: alpha/beta fold hydrolase [unclassified Adlercreutzia]MEC4273648.1 alpha/beta fold hydrolase [Adlercreutzia sp. R25]MEC4294080.1 alpha/beta fold hydrolase [Adlercreutzia sp. R22]